MKKIIILAGLLATGISVYAVPKVPVEPTPEATNFLENMDLTKLSDTLETFDNASDQCPADKQALVNSWLPESWQRFSHWVCGALYKHGFLSQDGSAPIGTSADPFE